MTGPCLEKRRERTRQRRLLGSGTGRLFLNQATEGLNP